MFDPQVWAAVPFHFWSVVLFGFGCMVGSLLNVCIHRMPLGQSIISPPSHCPHCKYAIPWYLNVPLFTWLFLRGKCANCKAPISARYFLVELLTGIVFLAAWLIHGKASPWVALVYCLVLSGLIVATFIDLEHFIIPDEITIGGIVVGFLLSAAVPALHEAPSAAAALKQSGIGIAAGVGVVYGIVRLGKLMLGRQRVQLDPDSRLTFTETALEMPGQTVPYEELFYRKSDEILFFAKRLEMNDRCYFNAEVRLSPESLHISEDHFNPEEVTRMEVVTDELTVPREAMGLGDVKFMGAIGAFLGWQAVLFSLMVSAFLGSAVGLTLIALKKHSRSNPIPYGPYIAVAAALWMFGGRELTQWWFSR